MIPILIFLLSGKVFAFDFPIEITEYIDDVKITAYINRNEIESRSQWTPFKSPPPLTIADTLKAVKTFIDENTEFANSTLTGIELKQIPHHKKFWHYLVKIKTMRGDIDQPHFFVVLMDGKVISAITRQGSIK